MIAIGGAGSLLSTTPLAMVTESMGWRVAFYGAAGLTALGALAIFTFVRDTPADRADLVRTPETVRESLRGVRAALATPGIPRLLGMGLASYPVVITVLGLWGGPYLIDAHGLDAVEAGNGLLIMAVTLIVANLILGPIEQRLDTRKGVVLGCAGTVLVALVVLACAPALATWQAIALFAVIGACGSFNIVLAGQARALFPHRLAGRGMALMAIAFMGGPAVLQSITGLIVGAVPAEGEAAPLLAYRALFGFLALVVGVALLGYARLPDARPSAGFARDDAP